MKILKTNVDITELSNFKLTATASYYYEINTRQDIDNISNIYRFAKNNNLKILFIWWWTNLLFAFDNFEWIIIKNNLLWFKYDKINKILESYSNELISNLAEKLEKDFNQDLWHRFIGLPWTIWWAIFWNAWCFWLETGNNFLSAEVLNLENGQIDILKKNNMNFWYRTSIIKENENKYFLISAKFDLSKKNEKYSSTVDNIYFRQNRQPKGKTCWSFFKNPSKQYSAWYLIEEVWLKWFKIWGAYFSDLHSNFLMNDWTATYKDLLKLIKLAQEKVKDKFNIDLVNEVRIIKNI